MVVAVLSSAGLAAAAAVLAARAWLATGKPLILPPRTRAAGDWACRICGATCLGFGLGDAIRNRRAGLLAVHPYQLAVALFLLALLGFCTASWHLAFVLGEDEQARRAGDRAQRAVLAALDRLGVEPAVRDTGAVDWRLTADRLDAGIEAGVFPGTQARPAARVHEQCRFLAEAWAVLPLRVRPPNLRARRELQALLRFTGHRPERWEQVAPGGRSAGHRVPDRPGGAAPQP